MNKNFTFLTLLLFLTLFQVEIFGQTFSTQWIRNNGPSSGKVDIAILGDGYTSSEQTKFITDVTTAVNGMFNAEPFSSLSNDYNVKAVKVISNVSGAASSPNALIDNYFGSTFGYAGIDRLLVPTRSQNITNVINANYPEADVIVVIVNTSKYGGSGGQYCTLSTNSQSVDLLIHEFGHTFGGLADEYWAGSQYATEKPNMTANGNASTIRWKQFLNQQGVGIYSHEESPSWYRPHQNCEMRYLGRQFCLVCQNQLVETTNSITGGNTGDAPAVPTGLSSTNVTATSFTAQWNASSGATSYTIQKWNSSAWTEAGTTSNTSLNLSGFSSGSTQYVRVKATNSSGSSEYSGYITVVLSNNTGTPPPVPTGLSSTNIAATTFTAQWDASAGATSYTVQKWYNSAWTDAGTTANTSLALSGFASGSTQYVRVKATNSYGSSSYSNSITVVLSNNTVTIPSIPAGLSSSNITSTTFTAQWNASAGATSYTVQKWYNSTWTDAGTTANTSLALSGFASGSTQYVRVKASNSAGSSAYSDYISVVLTNNSGTTPAIPTGLNASNISATSFTAQWNASSGATSYTVQKWYNSAWTVAGTTANTNLTLTGLSGSTQYIRVNASNSIGSSSYSSWISVNLNSAPPINNDEVAEYLYPNPASEKVFVRYEGNYAKVDFYSIQGSLIKSENLYGAKEINVSDLSPGAYIVFIHSDKNNSKFKLIKN